MTEFILVCPQDVLRFTRVGQTVDIYLNGAKINILDFDELKIVIAKLQALMED